MRISISATINGSGDHYLVKEFLIKNGYAQTGERQQYEVCLLQKDDIRIEVKPDWSLSDKPVSDTVIIVITCVLTWNKSIKSIKQAIKDLVLLATESGAMY
jgi:hypothetical protein